MSTKANTAALDPVVSLGSSVCQRRPPRHPSLGPVERPSGHRLAPGYLGFGGSPV
jgi:hypothetical protein